jgi:hypothetical protein
MSYRRSETARNSGEAGAGRHERLHRTHVRGADTLVQCRLADPVLHAQDRVATLSSSSPARRMRRESISTLPALAARCNGVLLPLLRASKRCLALP